MIVNLNNFTQGFTIVSHGGGLLCGVEMSQCQLNHMSHHLSNVRKIFYVINGGRRRYWASQADRAAWERAQRPKPCKLVVNRALARIVAKKLRQLWAPEQIEGRGECQDQVPGASAHAAPWLRIQVGQRRAGYKGHPALHGTQEYSTHSPLY